MATKKQKRAAMQAKREAYMQEVRESGLLAQKAARERLEMQRKAIKTAAEEINERHRAILAKHGMHEGGTLEEVSDKPQDRVIYGRNMDLTPLFNHE